MTTKNMSPVGDAQVATAGKPEPVRADDLDGSADLRSGGYAIQVWSEKALRGHALAWGYGTQDRNDGNTTFVYADLQQPDGSGGTEPMEGDLVLEVRDTDNQEVVADTKLGDLEDLRERKGMAVTERIVMPLYDEAAGPDKYLSLAVEATEASDGKTVDTDASSVRLVYTDLR